MGKGGLFGGRTFQKIKTLPPGTANHSMKKRAKQLIAL
jgi:hypothetical protein